MPQHQSVTPELLTVQEASRWARCSVSFLEKLRQRGEGPRVVRLGRAVRYRLSDLEAWTQGAAGGQPTISGGASQ